MKELFKYILLIIIVIGLGYLIFFKPSQTGLNTYHSDSVITIIYDSHTYQPHTNYQTIVKPVNTIYVPLKDSVSYTLCDSLRQYKPISENDSIKIVSDLWVRGKLDSFKLSYKWKRPVLIEKTYKVYPNYFMAGGSIKYPFAVGLNVGYKRNHIIYTGSYYTDKTVIIGACYQFGK